MTETPPMPHPTPPHWPTTGLPIGPWTLDGYSLGGIETAIRIPELRLAIDVGRGPQSLVRCDHIALTHTHMDHTGGLPYLLALRQLYGMKAPTVYVPDQLVEDLTHMLESWTRVQRHRIVPPIVGLKPGERAYLGRHTWIESFRTYHPIPSQGFIVGQSKTKLNPAYHGRPGRELAELKRQGVVIEDTIDHRYLAVTGDTLPQVLDKQPHILDADILMIECTFLDEQKPLDAVRAGGHIHISQLYDRAEQLKGKRLILYHFSQMHDAPQIHAACQALAKAIDGEVWAFPTLPHGPHSSL